MTSRFRAAIFCVAVVGSAFAATAATDDRSLVAAIQAAGPSTPVADLTATVRHASACCRDSAVVATALAGWLHEGSAIYAHRRPTEATQFRSFLMATLGAFPPNDELFRYVRAALLFPDHPLDVAAAAVAARAFPRRAAELTPLMIRFLDPAFQDEPLDVTTPDLVYPPAHRSSARHEIVKTLAGFAANASAALPELEAIAKCTRCEAYASDMTVVQEAAKAAEIIRSSAPVAPAPHEMTGLRLLDPGQRRNISSRRLRLLDQDGNAFSFHEAGGRPFVLAFFYARCATASKCAMTLHHLGTLGRECESTLPRRVGIYGVTLDPFFDRPSLLRTYGTMHGMHFSPTIRLLTTASPDEPPPLIDELHVRVSYGAGSVNVHGVQLFIFDKKGRLAATVDEDMWSTADVKHALAMLADE